MPSINTNTRPTTDLILQKMADYVLTPDIGSAEAFATARLCLMDSLGCALQALAYPACRKMLGPIVPGANMPGGARVPGTAYELEPMRAAFNIGTMIRWLDFNDTWLAAEWGHPSDNLGGILAVADYLSRQSLVTDKPPLLMREVLEWMIKAHEIQGITALENSFNRVGLDHVLLVRISTTAVVTGMLGGDRQSLINALSNAFIDGGALRTYRHAPNTGSRKSWAAGDASSRGVFHALTALRGEMGYPTALSAGIWGFQDVLFGGKALSFKRPFGSYVMENVLFKVSYPAEFHAQTAVEAAVLLHPQIKDKLAQIDRIVIETQEPALRIIDKTGPLDNPADRDHCLQYMIAIGLLKGDLKAEDYEDDVASDPRIDALRSKIKVSENPRYSREYLEEGKRAISNSLQIYFNDGSSTNKVTIDYPVGHRRRRAESLPLLQQKFEANLADHFDTARVDNILKVFAEAEQLDNLPVHEFMELFICA